MSDYDKQIKDWNNSFHERSRYEDVPLYVFHRIELAEDLMNEMAERIRELERNVADLESDLIYANNPNYDPMDL